MTFVGIKKRVYAYLGEYAHSRRRGVALIRMSTSIARMTAVQGAWDGEERASWPLDICRYGRY